MTTKTDYSIYPFYIKKKLYIKRYKHILLHISMPLHFVLYIQVYTIIYC